jgi:F420-non-reducing hydrogenase iron-sulfur subunit
VIVEKGSDTAGNAFRPKILVFSTVSISDIGIDLAGSSHMHYPPTALSIPIPCSSGVRPDWILYALGHGFDGVFIAADGGDCPFVPDCTDRTAKLVGEAQDLLRKNDIKPERLKMAAICSVCAEPFQKHMKNFFDALKELGPTKKAG